VLLHYNSTKKEKIENPENIYDEIEYEEAL